MNLYLHVLMLLCFYFNYCKRNLRSKKCLTAIAEESRSIDNYPCF